MSAVVAEAEVVKPTPRVYKLPAERFCESCHRNVKLADMAQDHWRGSRSNIECQDCRDQRIAQRHRDKTARRQARRRGGGHRKLAPRIPLLDGPNPARDVLEVLRRERAEGTSFGVAWAVAHLELEDGWSAAWASAIDDLCKVWESAYNSTGRTIQLSTFEESDRRGSEGVIA